MHREAAKTRNLFQQADPTSKRKLADKPTAWPFRGLAER